MTTTASSPFTVIIYGNCHQDQYLPKIESMIRQMSEAGIRSMIERRFAAYLSANSYNPASLHCDIIDTPPHHARAAISIGGDGTFLRTARWVGRLDIPILGINTGHLGFLASYTLDEAPSLIEMLISGTGITERRSVLQVCSPGLPADIFPYALNEVAILKEDTSSMISVNVDTNGIFLADYLADGLLISTPTGSTGYNLSVGGPLLQPTLNAICISPIAPHSLTLRPIVVDGDTVINARTTTRARRYRVSLDGCSFVMDADTSIRVSNADFCVKILRRSDSDFAATMRNKLHWGQR